MASTREGHIKEEYDLLRDESGPDGTRTIILKKKDLPEIQRMRDELVEKLCEKLGEPKESKMIRKIILDALKDYNLTSLKRIYNKVVLGEVPVKARPGCFEIIIGDGRKKNSDIIQLRE